MLDPLMLQGSWSFRERTPGVEDADTGSRVVMTFTASASAGEDLVGHFAAVRGDLPEREIKLKPC